MSLVNPSKQESRSASKSCKTVTTVGSSSTNSQRSFLLGSSSSRTTVGVQVSPILRRKQDLSSSFYSSYYLDLYIQTGKNNIMETKHTVDGTDSATRRSLVPPPTTRRSRNHTHSDHQTFQSLHSTLEDESKTHKTNTNESGYDVNLMIQAPLVHTPRTDKNRATYQQYSYDQQEAKLPRPLNILETFESKRARHITEEARAHETCITNPLLSDVAFSNTVGSTRTIHKFNDFDLFTNPYLYDQMTNYNSTTTSTTNAQQELNLHASDRHSGTYFTNAVFDNVCKVLSSPSDQNLRQKMPIGFPGLACLHCQGLSRKKNGGRYFPSSLKTLSDSKKTLFAIYQHLQKCDKCPDEIKKDLQILMSGHEEERRKQSRGSQTSYFLAVWQTIHGSPPPDLTTKKSKKKKH